MAASMPKLKTCSTNVHFLLKSAANMRYLVMLFMLLLTAPILYSADSPLKATNVAVYVLQYRQTLSDQKGWVPVYRAVVHFTIQNVSQSVINAAMLCLQFDPNVPPHNQDVCDMREHGLTYPLTLQPGQSVSEVWPKVFTYDGDPQTGAFISAGEPITVVLQELRYANGFSADFGMVPIGTAVIPASPMKLPTKSGCGSPEELAGNLSKISEPVMLEGYERDLEAAQGFVPGSPKTVSFRLVVDKNGMVCSAEMLQGSYTQGDFGSGGRENGNLEKMDRSRIEAMKKIRWFPAVQNDTPVAVEFVETFTSE